MIGTDRVDVDEVLVSEVFRRRAPYAVHLPGEEDPREPQCHVTLDGDREFRLEDPDDLDDSFTLCKFCDPDVEVDHASYGERPSTKLGRLDPEDLGLSPIDERRQEGSP